MRMMLNHSIVPWRTACSARHVLLSCCTSPSRQRPMQSHASAPDAAAATSSVVEAVQIKKTTVGFPFDMVTLTDGKPGVTADAMIEMLHPFLFDGRPERIQKVASQRTYAVLPIVEGLYNMGNLAAICRSADGEGEGAFINCRCPPAGTPSPYNFTSTALTAMGFGAVHCINTFNGEYKQSARTSAGADKWLEVNVWEGGSHNALSEIKAAGYQLVVTHLSKGSVPIQVLNILLSA